MQRLFLTLGLLLSAVSADAAIITSSTTQNLSATAFVDGDQINVTAGTLTISSARTIGDSRPARPETIPTGASVAGGGSLASATYQFAYTNVDSGGKESAISPGSAGVAITSGNTLRITMPAKPTGVATRNIYLAAGSASYKLYATGTTGMTYDCTSASWTNGTTTEAAAAAVPNNWAISMAAGTELIIDGVVVKVRGATNPAGTITLNGAATWEWDASAADSPSNTSYGDFAGTSNSGQSTRSFRTTNTSSSTRATIRSNAGGANGFFRSNIGAGFVGTFTKCGNWNVKFVDFQRIGSSTRDAIAWSSDTADTNIQVIEDSTFDADCGAVFHADVAGPAAGWSVTRTKFLQTNARQIVTGVSTPFAPRSNNTTPTATNAQRRAENCYFAEKPRCGQWSSWVGNYFRSAWSNPGDANRMLEWDGNVVRLTSAGPVTDVDVTGNYYIFDPPLTLKTSGTATGGSNATTSGTLTDSGASWGTTQYAYGTSQTCHQVRITAGIGAGQVRRIVTHTATTLTVQPPWTTTPDATSQYEIRLDIYNPHYINAGTAASRTYLCDDNVFENGGTDPNGDAWKSFAGASNYRANRNLVLPNGSGVDTSACMITAFSNTPSGARIRTDHNTVCIGAQSAFQVDEGGTNQPAGTYEFCRSNLAFAMLPASAYTGGLNGFLICNSDNPSSGTIDIIDPANILKNWLYRGRHTEGEGGNGINIRLSVASEAPIGTADPQFVDPTRNLASWGATQGTDGTLTAALALFASDPTLIPTARDWVKAGFAPQNAATEDAGHDGVTIGAVEYQSASTPLTAPIPVVDNKTFNSVTISWPAATGGTAPYTYKVEYKEASSGTWIEASSNATSPYTITGLSPATAYNVRVRVVDSSP